jgi:predicted membrane GTPase involved in stress response
MYVSTAGEKSRLLPLYQLDLEQAIECINADECMEVTLQHLHVRQRILGGNMRPKWQE